MIVALVLLAATYAAVVALCAFLIAYRPSYAWLWIAALVALSFSFAARYGDGAKALLRAVGAEVGPAPADSPVRAAVERLAGLAGIAAPEVAIAETDSLNAFAVGLRRRSSTVVVTRGLIRALTAAELEAVLAHEVSHLVNRDAAVMTAVSSPRTLGEVVVSGAGEGFGLLWLIGWPLGLFPYVVGTGLTLTVSRAREFAADRGAAMLTGAPAALMSALQKIAGHAAEIPHDDLRAANAFCIVSTEAHRFSFLSDHPPLEKRLAALAQIQRELGRAVG